MSINKSKLTKSIQDRGGYFTGPNEIWTLPISSKAKIVYLYLISQSDTWNPGSREIAAGTSIGRDSVREALKELEFNKMITISEGPHGLRNVYDIAGLKEWDFTSTGPKHVHPLDLPRSTTGRNQVHIQEESNKLANTKLASEVKNSFKDTKLVPEFEVKTSPWYQHYLKSSYNEETFNSLPLKTRQSLYDQTLKLKEIDGSEAKDKFISALNLYRMSKTPVKPSVNLDHLDFGL